MKDKAFCLAEAMTYIDDRFLEEAHPEAKSLSPETVNRKKTIRRIALVACLCLVAISLPRLPALLGGMMDMGAGNAHMPENAGPDSYVENETHESVSIVESTLTESEPASEPESETRIP